VAEAPYEHELGLMEDGSDVGGDDQEGDPIYRRFMQRLDDGNYTVIDVYAYASLNQQEREKLENGEEGVVYDVTALTQSTLCTDVNDPGSTELDANYEYDYPFSVGYDSLEDATAAARNYIKSLEITHFGWASYEGAEV
jgi:hypothetical protein